MDFTTLNWIKRELDETLQQARQSLEAYVEEPADFSLLRFCASYLHQVQGTLKMVELYAASKVAEEMEATTQSLLNGWVLQKEEAYAALMRGIVQLPDYLERLQSGHKDIPVVFLPLINDLRALRNEKPLAEVALFFPDFSIPVPIAETNMPPLVVEELPAALLKLRSNFQMALLKWFRGESSSDQLSYLIGILDRLRGLSSNEEARRLWWIASVVLEVVHQGGQGANPEIKLLIGKVDREIKRMAEAGEADLQASELRDLVRHMLYFIAHTSTIGARGTEVRHLFQLENFLYTPEEIEHAKSSISGRNRALLSTVAQAVKDDLIRVKESLDIFLRAPGNDPAELMAQAEALGRVAETLGMMGLPAPRSMVLEQRQIIREVAEKSRSAEGSVLLNVAGALLYTEASLDDHIDRLGGASSQEGASSSSTILPSGEMRKVLEALFKETSINLTIAKQDITAFIESPWEHARVEAIPRLLREIGGALRVLHLPEAANFLDGIIQFVDVELLKRQHIPTAEQLDRLADALASLEYYLEATREERRGRDAILNVTRQSLEALGYWPLPAQEEMAITETVVPKAIPSSSSISTHSPESSSASVVLESSSETHAPGWQERSLETLVLPPTLETTWPRNEEGMDLSFSTTTHLVSSQQADDLHDFIAELDKAVPGISPSGSTLSFQTGELIEPAFSSDVSILSPAETLSGETPATEFTLPILGEQAVNYIEIVEEIEEEVLDDEAVSSALATDFQLVPSEEIDQEILEVFIEEFQEEIENLKRLFPLWQSDSKDFELLKPIRRSFHTLKGSGRLVGALGLGEFSWKIEHLLNRVLDRSIESGSSVPILLEHAINALPELLEALRGNSTPRANISDMMTVADKLANGEEAWLEAPKPPRMKTVKRFVRKLVPTPETFTDGKLSVTTTVAETMAQEVTNEESSAKLATDNVAASPTAAAQSMLVQENLVEEHAVVTEVFEAVAENTTASASTLLTLDPVLFDILRSEVATHLAVIDSYLMQGRDQSLLVSEELLRAVHTLNGAIAMIDIPVIGHVLAPLEGYVKRLRVTGTQPGDEGCEALQDASVLVKEVMQALETQAQGLPNSDELVARITQLRDNLAEPPASPQQLLASLEEPSAVEDAITSSVEQASAFVLPEESETNVTAIADELTFATLPVEEFPEALILTVSEELAATPDEDQPYLVQDIEISPLSEEVTVFSVMTDEQEIGDMETQDDIAQIVKASKPETIATELSTVANLGDEDVEATAFPAVLDEPDVNQPVAKTVKSDDIAVAEETETGIDSPVVATETVSLDPFLQPQPLGQLPSIPDDPQPDGRLTLADLDADLLEVFTQEAHDILDHSDSLLAGLRDNPQDHALIIGLQRDLHTFKGGARMANLAPIADLSHAMESLLELVSDQRRQMDSVILESLERAYDHLHLLTERVAKSQAIAMPVNMIARFQALVGGQSITLLAAQRHVQSLENEHALDFQPPTSLAQDAGSITQPKSALVSEEQDEPLRAQQEMIRVRAELLDSLVNYAGEVSIYRSRLEQQISTFRFNLVEFEQTVNRLRDQLRKLEIETEAQILSRFQREAEISDATFDPLELDRFSQQQQLSRALAESVSDLGSIQNLLDELTRQSETLLLQQSRVSSDLQEGLMRTRMVPFDSLVPSLRRTVRQAAAEVSKRIQLKVEGAQGEMDRNLLERMKAPFEHMLRNAVAHGIESPEERAKIGKPLEGNVTIAVSREGTEVVIRVSDDGKGMDRDAIRRKAIERGLLHRDAQLSDRDIYGFVLETGFSTAENITQLAGRGVGMDVVYSEIKQLGGSLAIDSTRGKGTTFIVRLPFTLAITQAILIRLGDVTYAVPMSSVQSIVRVPRDEFNKCMSQPIPTFNYAGEDFLIYEWWKLLGVEEIAQAEDQQIRLLLTRTGDQRAAVRIGSVIGAREVVVKSVGPQISSVPGIFGATIMGDGAVVMILDLAPLVRRNAALREQVGETAVTTLELSTTPTRHITAFTNDLHRKPMVMVVDDSITMRKVTTRVLERCDMQVITAKDGLDALEKLHDVIPDLVLRDIEWRRMDGYELGTHMKNDARLHQVPIMMITSRTGEKHRQKALEIGVERYLGKPYQEIDLIKNAQEMLRLRRAEH